MNPELLSGEAGRTFAAAPLLGGCWITLPFFLSKVLLNRSLHPIFYFRLAAIKCLHIPMAVLAVIDNPAYTRVGPVIRPRVYLQVAIGAKRCQIIDAHLAIPPRPTDAKKSVLGVVDSIVGFTSRRRVNQNHNRDDDGERAKRQQTEYPYRNGDVAD